MLEQHIKEMTYIFHDYMHDIVEDYVDNLLAKFKTREQHLEILIKIFDRLLEFNVQLNPKKGVFGVTSKNLLGFIVSQGVIEVDPNKIKVITNMPLPSNIKQLQSLQRKLQAIKRFISKLLDKCKPFTKLLKKGIIFYGGIEQQEALEEIKGYLLTPPMLIPPGENEPFLLYSSATKNVLGIMLAQKNEYNKEKAIYYLSRTLVNYEVK